MAKKTRQDVARLVGRHVRPGCRSVLHTYLDGGGLFLPWAAIKDWGAFTPVLQDLDHDDHVGGVRILEGTGD